MKVNATLTSEVGGNTIFFQICVIFFFFGVCPLVGGSITLSNNITQSHISLTLVPDVSVQHVGLGLAGVKASSRVDVPHIDLDSSMVLGTNQPVSVAAFSGDVEIHVLSGFVLHVSSCYKMSVKLAAKREEEVSSTTIGRRGDNMLTEEVGSPGRRIWEYITEIGHKRVTIAE